jgi:hypothetical protein
VKIAGAIEQVGQAEAKLVRGLAEVGEHHRADHDVFHVTRTLAGMETDNLRRLRSQADRYDASLPDHPEVSAAEADEPEPGSDLLDDLRTVYVLAAEASIDWLMLGQGAQAVKDDELLATVSACHEQSLRTLKWATDRIKTSAPQALATG